MFGGWSYGFHVASTGLTSIDRSILPYADLVPAWYGSREVLFHRGNPYSMDVTRKIQIAFYGAEVGAGVDQQQFAYPAFSAFLFLAFAALPFVAAERFALISFAALTAGSVFWWAGKPTYRSWILATLLTAATFPFFYAFHGRQPTLLIAGVLAASYAAARSGKLVLCGLLLAIAVSKPQLAISVALPIGTWCLSEVRARKAVAFSFVGGGCFLMIASEFFSPNWFTVWIGVLRVYQGYVAARSLLVLSCGQLAGGLISLVLLSSAVFVAWACREDLPFTVAYCIATFSLIIPFHFYDELLLLAPISWLVFNRGQMESWTSRLLLAAVSITLCLGWFSAIAILLLYLANQRAALILWEFPLGLSEVLPYSVFIVLCHHAFLGRFRSFARSAQLKTYPI